MGKKERQRAKKLKKGRQIKQLSKPVIQKKKTLASSNRLAQSRKVSNAPQPRDTSGHVIPQTVTAPSMANQSKKRARQDSVTTSANSTTTDGHQRSQRQNEPFLYTMGQNILILGDGDFSFSRAVLRRFQEKDSTQSKAAGRNLLCTSFDSKKVVMQKYKNAESCLNELRESEAVIRHGVDATKLQFGANSFDRIIFNFPHSGKQRVHINRVLLRDFFKAAKQYLTQEGEVHVALKVKPPYSNWNIEQQAMESGLLLKARLPFKLAEYPGYHHRTTDPLADKFEQDFCRTFAFVVDPTKI